MALDSAQVLRAVETPADKRHRLSQPRFSNLLEQAQATGKQRLLQFLLDQAQAMGK